MAQRFSTHYNGDDFGIQGVDRDEGYTAPRSTRRRATFASPDTLIMQWELDDDGEEEV